MLKQNVISVWKSESPFQLRMKLESYNFRVSCGTGIAGPD